MDKRWRLKTGRWVRDLRVLFIYLVFFGLCFQKEVTGNKELSHRNRPCKQRLVCLNIFYVRVISSSPLCPQKNVTIKMV